MHSHVVRRHTIRRVVALGALVLVQRAAAAEPSAAAAFEPPRGVIALHDALAAALLGNPDLAATAWEARASEARALQAGLRPNPQLGTEVEDFGGSGERRGWHSAQSTVSLSQLVELGGKRAKRQRVAALEQRLADWDYETLRLTVLTQTTQAFIETLAAQERLDLAREIVGIADRSAAVVRSTVRSGAVSPVEAARAEVASSRARLDVTQLERHLDAARAALAAMWGADTPTFEAVRGDFGRLTPPPSLAALQSRIAANPDLARWATELDARRARVDVERAQRIPDVTVRVGARRFAETGDDALVAELTIPLPVFDRNQGNLLAAERNLAKAGAERRGATATVQARLATAYQSMRAAFERATALHDGVIPAAERVWRGAEDAYAKGLFRFVEALDAQRTLFELRDEYLQTAAAYHANAAEVERLTGTPLADASPKEVQP